MNNKGVTLIALIVTIIVLLILAAVSIVGVMNNNGILTKTQEAKNETMEATARDKVNQAKAEAVDSSASINIDKLRTKLEEKGGSLEGEEFPVIAHMDGFSYSIDDEGITKEYKGTIEDQVTLGFLKIGDYVNYSPDSVEPYHVDEKYLSRAGSDNDFENENLKWRILDISDDGKIRIISDLPTSKYLSLKENYNYDVYVRNDLCSKVFSNAKYGSATVIKLEDVTSKLKTLDVNTNSNYGKVMEFSISSKYTSKYYPTLALKESYISINGTSGNEITDANKQDNLSEEKINTFSVGDTIKAVNTMFTTNALTENDFNNKKYYELFVMKNGKEMQYIFGTRCFCYGSDSEDEWYDFTTLGMGYKGRIIDNSGIGGNTFTAYSGGSVWGFIRPVVTLYDNVKVNLTVGDGTENNPWGLEI